MQKSVSWKELLNREENFVGPNSNLNELDERWLCMYEALYYCIASMCSAVKSDEDDLDDIILDKVYTQVYDFLCSIYNYGEFSMFNSESILYQSAFEICRFMGGCSFIHETKRCNSLSLRQFVYLNSPEKYHVKGSKKYFDPKYSTVNSEKQDEINNVVSTLRQHRHRFFTKKENDIRRPNWAAMPKSSVHEWSLYFVLEDPKISKIYKRINNRFSIINKALNAPRDDQYIDNLIENFNKFVSRTEKDKHEDFIFLSKTFLTHVKKDPTYYGMNLYRFEKNMQLYLITDSVKQLSRCKNQTEENIFLAKFFVLSELCFPKLRNQLFQLEDISEIFHYSTSFKDFLVLFILMSRLIIDQLIEDHVLSDNWESSILSQINNLAEKVLFNPDAIDSTVTPEYQNFYQTLVISPIAKKVNLAIFTMIEDKLRKAENPNEILKNLFV